MLIHLQFEIDACLNELKLKNRIIVSSSILLEQLQCVLSYMDNLTSHPNTAGFGSRKNKNILFGSWLELFTSSQDVMPYPSICLDVHGSCKNHREKNYIPFSQYTEIEKIKTPSVTPAKELRPSINVDFSISQGSKQSLSIWFLLRRLDFLQSSVKIFFYR